MNVARTTLETLLLAQAIEPLTRGAGLLGDVEAEAFARSIAAHLDGRYGRDR